MIKQETRDGSSTSKGGATVELACDEKTQASGGETQSRRRGGRARGTRYFLDRLGFICAAVLLTGAVSATVANARLTTGFRGPVGGSRSGITMYHNPGVTMYHGPGLGHRSSGFGGQQRWTGYGGGVRPWVAAPYYGTVIAGVTLGAIIAATAAPPAPGLCWFWASPEQDQGYWDYCS